MSGNKFLIALQAIAILLMLVSVVDILHYLYGRGIWPFTNAEKDFYRQAEDNSRP